MNVAKSGNLCDKFSRTVALNAVSALCKQVVLPHVKLLPDITSCKQYSAWLKVTARYAYILQNWTINTKTYISIW